LPRPIKSRSRIFFEYWLPVLAYVALIITLSAQPQVRPPVDFLGVDKWLHMIEYGGLGFVLVRALRASMPRRDPLVAAFSTLGAGLVMAVGDEVFQSFIPGRDSSHLDVMADVAGLVVAMLLRMAFTRD
jgi:VanZ family protein